MMMKSMIDEVDWESIWVTPNGSNDKKSGLVDDDAVDDDEVDGSL